MLLSEMFFSEVVQELGLFTAFLISVLTVMRLFRIEIISVLTILRKLKRWQKPSQIIIPNNLEVRKYRIKTRLEHQIKMEEEKELKALYADVRIVSAIKMRKRINQRLAIISFTFAMLFIWLNIRFLWIIIT